jgi:hypothetical protein
LPHRPHPLAGGVLIAAAAACPVAHAQARLAYEVCRAVSTGTPQRPVAVLVDRTRRLRLGPIELGVVKPPAPDEGIAPTGAAGSSSVSPTPAVSASTPRALASATASATAAATAAAPRDLPAAAMSTAAPSAAWTATAAPSAAATSTAAPSATVDTALDTGFHIVVAPASAQPDSVPDAPRAVQLREEPSDCPGSRRFRVMLAWGATTPAQAAAARAPGRFVLPLPEFTFEARDEHDHGSRALYAFDARVIGEVAPAAP